MLYFSCDYAEGCHPKLLKALTETNLESTPGYGEDKYCELAKTKIRAAIGNENADIYFLVGGTQTNQLMIDCLINPYQGVVAARTGHVAVHEAGAIEYTGHKVLEIPGYDGKIKADDLHIFLKDFYLDGNHEHMVEPGMVYISFPTEYGTIYSKKELEDIYAICQEYSIPLYIDGARLGYALVCDECDLTLKNVAALCDAFYIGGTKVGALMGEAAIFTKNNTPRNMITRIKQHGALLAKGRLLGIQFNELFTDDLYYEISRNAIECANIIKEGLKAKGYKFFLQSPTNQIFIVMDNKRLEEFGKEVSYGFWEKYDDDHTVVRIATCWATQKKDAEELLKKL